MSSSYYKYCIVPQCKSTNIKTPDKLFIYVPNNQLVRKKWLTLARRIDAHCLSTNTRMYFCEDHFDMQKDMENYTEYRIMGKVSQIRMRPGCLPTKFACQPDRENTLSDSSQFIATKRKKQTTNKECEELKHKRIISPQSSNTFNTDIANPISDQSHEHHEESNTDKDVWIYVPAKHQIETSQSENKLHTKKTSPNKNSVTSGSINSFNGLLSIESNVKDCYNEDNTSESDASTCSASEQFSLSLSDFSDHSNTEYFEKAESNEEDLEKEVNSMLTLKLTLNKIENKSQFYVGVPKNCYFLIKIIHEHTGIPEHHILLCLKKIRLDSMFAELGDEFAITKSYARKIFMANISKIAQVMKPFIVTLDESAIRECLPKVFTKRYSNITCFIDCIEIEIEKPSNALNNFFTWSECKKANTVKYLISSVPNGLINFVSQGYGGRINDVTLVENSGFLKCLPKGSNVMAKGRFKNLESLLHQVGCQLIETPSTETDYKLLRKVNQSKRIASMQILIEQAIQQVRHFTMLTPYACINNKLVGKLDNIIVIACGLVNLHASVIRK